jgi:hypothetical protein
MNRWKKVDGVKNELLLEQIEDFRMIEVSGWNRLIRKLREFWAVLDLHFLTGGSFGATPQVLRDMAIWC